MLPLSELSTNEADSLDTMSEFLIAILASFQKLAESGCPDI